MERIFRLRGRVVNRQGQPLSNVVVAVVDADAVFDDLLGVGRTYEDGTFRLAFTRTAFNQEAFEREAFPDLYVMLAGRQQLHQPLVPLLRQDFLGLRWAGEEDLGDLVCPYLEPPPVALVNQPLFPGSTKRARRLKLDAELLAAAVADMVPRVEALTGWTGLAEGLALRIDDGMGASISEGNVQNGIFAAPHTLGERLLGQATSAFLTQWTRLCGNLAAHVPELSAVVVDGPRMETQGYDGLRAIMGHELVHVGQHRYHPELRAETVRLGKLLQQEDLSAEARAEATRALGALRANLEGYASYLEQGFLRRKINCAQGHPHHSLLDRALLRLLDQFQASPDGGLQGTGRAPAPQETAKAQLEREAAAPYDAGHAAYRALQDQRGGPEPVPFDPALRPELP